MSNPITVSDEAVEAALAVWSAAAWDHIRLALVSDPKVPMRAALEAAAPFMREAIASAAEAITPVAWDGLFNRLDDIRQKQADRKGKIWDQIHEAREVLRFRYPRTVEDQRLFDALNKALYILSGDPINIELEEVTKQLRASYNAHPPEAPAPISQVQPAPSVGEVLHDLGRLIAGRDLRGLDLYQLAERLSGAVDDVIANAHAGVSPYSTKTLHDAIERALFASTPEEKP
jgi:hypothetical protein